MNNLQQITTPPTFASGESDAAQSKPLWNPYLVGASIGVLSWLAFPVVNQPIGVPTSLSAASGACAAPLLGSDFVWSNPYWVKTPLNWDYGMLFLIGIFLGSLISTLVSHRFRLEKVPGVWSEYFGPSAAKRMIVAFIGGILTMYGARMAGGCTSGHGISGALQLAVSSWVFFLTMFVAGVITAALVFRHRRTTNA